MRRLALGVLALLLLAAAPDPTITLDDFEDLAAWKAVPSDGLDAALSSTDGLHGRALRLDFDFHNHGGYVVIRRDLPLDLPENYEITFQVRGEGPPNNLEFKLIDPTNENVWWFNRRDFEPPREWTESRIKKRHIQFAWGPKGGGEIRRVAALEIAVTAGKGGRGFLLLDDLKITPLPPEHPYTLKPRLTASAPDAGKALDRDPETAWRAPAGPAWIAVDFLERREYGGLIVQWEPGRFAIRYEVQVSNDGAAWTTLRTVSGSRGGRNGKDYLYLPETDSRHLRLRLLESAGPQGYGLAEIAVQPLEFGASLNALFQAIARDATRGRYPRAFSGEQPYWTVVGVDADTSEALFDEDGRIETGKSSFSIEPFLFVDGKLIAWADVQTAQSLEDGDLPIPSVTWKSAPLSLTITPVAAGEPGKSFLSARYRIANHGAAPVSGRLYLAVRPFQVNPPWQFLNVPGGVAPIRKVSWDGRAALVDGTTLVPIDLPNGFGAATFDEGDVTDRLARGELPAGTRIEDPFGHASAAFAWDLRLAPGEERDVRLAFPFHSEARIPQTGFEELLNAERKRWREKLDRVEIRLPVAAEPVIPTLRSNLAYILINRDGPGIQ
ncbi:MAG TPA: discoidin domain-containing protein, partial [Thermoanaerobaculia bacterium]|nr:discoidin domain-containing protein [Thermoanaerobaculia bacterium]